MKVLAALFVLFVFIVLAAGLTQGYIVSHKSIPGVPKGWVKLQSYVYHAPGTASCDAIMPECGYCPGKLVDKTCYVDRQTEKRLDGNFSPSII